LVVLTSCGISDIPIVVNKSMDDFTNPILEQGKNQIPEVNKFLDCEKKILSLAPWDVSCKNVVQNYFKIESYQPYYTFDSKNAEFYAYFLQKENDILLASNYLGLIVIGNKNKEGYILPTKIYFQQKNDTFEQITVTYDDVYTIYTYKNSVIYVNNQDATKPFDLIRSHVDFAEFVILPKNLKSTTALQFIKYFFDFLTYQNGAKVTYFDKNYFNVKFNNLDTYYISVNDPKDKIKDGLQRFMNAIDDAQEDGKNLYFTKLYIDFPAVSYCLEAIKHVILLVKYDNRFFILDTNGGLHSSCRTPNFAQAMRELNIYFSHNTKFIQSGNNCDTCASMVAFAFSYAWRISDNKLPMNSNGDFDNDRILYLLFRNFPQKNFIAAWKNFFI